MSTRSRPRTPAQVRLAKIITTYVQHLMDAQAGMCNIEESVTVVPPTDDFPSFDFFCAEFVPNISVEKYTQRLVVYMMCSAEAYIFALVYIRRVFICGFPLDSRSIHRVLLTAVVVAAKLHDDTYYRMGYYAQVGGVSTRDLTLMELRFLVDLIDFRADVLLEEYRTVCNRITELDSIQGIGRSTFDICCPTVHNSPAESGVNGTALQPDWIAECQIFW